MTLIFISKMHTIILVEKNGTLSQKQVKTFDKLYTTCNYRNDNNFELLHTWDRDDSVYELYGKKHKKLNNENTYTFMSIQTIFYGNLCIVKKKNGEPDSLQIKEWEEFHGAVEQEPVPEEETNEIEEIPYTVSDDKELVHEEYEEE
jgi:hypothetical protein